MSTLVAVRQSSQANVWSAIAKTFLHAFLICLGVIVIYPLIWMALNRFKNNAQIFGDPFALPLGWSWTNYTQAWNQGVRDYVTVSVLVTVTSAICTVLVSAWTAYGLTRTRMPAKPLVVGFVLGGLMLSPTVALIPLVKLMQALGLYNTYWALIILYTAFRIPFSTFLIRAYMLEPLTGRRRSRHDRWRKRKPDILAHHRAAVPSNHRVLHHSARPVRLERVSVRHDLFERAGRANPARRPDLDHGKASGPTTPKSSPR